MSNKVVFEVYVDDNGTLKAATKGVHDLGAEVGKTASAHTSASKAADGHFNRQEKGIIGTANSTRSFSKLRSTIDGGSGSLVGAYATLAANIFAVSAAYLALKDAAQLQQVEAGIESMGNRMGITLSLTTKKVAELSGGLLTAQQAAVSTAQTMAAGFKTNDLERITVVARQASLTLGRDMTDSMDRLTRGIIKLEPELLDELGIMTRLDEANQIYARQNGKVASALTVTEKRQAFLNAALAEGELKFGGISGDDKLNNIAKLGTAFKDLTKDILNAVNVLAIPLAGILGSKGLLIGGMVLFASTISNQLLPGLTKSAEKAKELAESTSKATMASVRSLKTPGAAVGGGGAEFSKILKDAKKGTAELTDIRRNYQALNAELLLGEDKLSGKAIFGNKETAESVEKVVAARRKQILVSRELLVTESQAAVARAQSNALSLDTSNMKPLEAAKAKYKYVTEAADAYKAKLFAASDASIGFERTGSKVNSALIKTRAGFMGAAIGAKVFGAAMLNALPIIGQAILVATLLWEGLTFLYTKVVGSDVIAANKELNTITKALNDKAIERKKIAESLVPVALKEQKQAELLSNAINEVTDAYDKANAAKKAKESKATVSRSKLDIEAGVVPSQVVPEDKSAKKQIKELRELSPEMKDIIDKEIELRGGIDKVNKSAERQARVIHNVRDAYSDYGASITAVTEALKEANNQAGALVKSNLPSTQYDAFALSLANVNKSLSEAYSSSVKIGSSLTTMANVASGIGPELQKFLTPDTQKALDSYREQTSLIAELTKKGKERTVYEEQTLKKAEATLPALKSNLTVVTSELSVLEDQITARRVESIALDSIIKLEQARLNKMNKTAALSGDEVKRRIKAENNVIELQARQIEAGNWILKLELQNIQLIREKSEAYNNYIKKIKEGNLEAEIGYLQAKIADNERKASEEKSPLMKGLIKDDTNAALAKLAQIADEKALQRKEAIVKAGIAANNNAAEAARMAKTSSSVANARGEEQDAKAALDLAEAKLSVQEMAVKAAQQEYAYKESIGTINDSAYLSAIAYYNKIVPLLKEKISLEAEANEKSLQAILAEKLDGGASADDIRILEQKIQLVTDEKNAKLEILEVESKTNLVKALSIELEADRIDRLKKVNDLLIEQKELSLSVLEAQQDLAKTSLELQAKLQGRELSAGENRKAAIEEAKLAYDSAVAISEIKKESIRLEYALLKAKYTVERDALNSTIRNQTAELTRKDHDPAVRAQLEATRDNLMRYSEAMGSVIEGLSTSERNSLDLINLATDKAEKLWEIAKAPQMLQPSGVAPSATSLLPEGAGVREKLFALNSDLEPFFEKLKALGPDGEFVSSVVQGSIMIADSIKLIGEAGFNTKEGIASSLNAGVAILGQLNSMYAAGSAAKVAAIDREIAAEQKRDGKSSESVAKIAAMEKKKDAQQKKAFEVNKKMMMAQVVMSTAASIAMVLGQTGLFGIPLVPLFAALGAAQLAIIASSSYQGGSASTAASSTPSSLSIGKRSDSVDLAKNNVNAGGESGYLTGAQGQGSSASNFRRAAYGGRAGIIVGEKGPEEFIPETGMILPADKTAQNQQAPISASISIQALDAQGVEDVLTRQRGHIISMLREAANANGQNFLENVSVAQYKQARRM
jgi:hypothetical protein